MTSANPRITTDVSRIVALLALVIGTLAVLSPAAHASPGAPCKVTNLTTAQVYKGSGSNLQSAIDQAANGTRLRVRGHCVGNYTIGKDLTLIGAPTAAFPTPALDGNASGTVLFVSAGLLTLTDLTITNGNGGGIVNRAPGTVRLTGSSAVSGNVAGAGAGIVNNGTLIMQGGSSVSGNVAEEAAGILSSGTLTMSGSSSVSDNHSTGEEGGGIVSLGTLTMNDSSSVSRNTVSRIGAGIYIATGTLSMNDASSVRGNKTLTRSSFGGGIFNFGSVTLRDSSLVAGNRSRRGRGGGIATHGTVDLYGSSSVSGNHARVGGGIDNWGGTVAMHGTSSVRGNAVAWDGGGIYNHEEATLTLMGSSSVTGNTAGVSGGGIRNSFSTLTLMDSSSVTANTSTDLGGGILNNGTLTLMGSSSVTGNTAGLSGGGIFSSDFIVYACDTWTGAISPNTPDDPPVLTTIAC
jgi:hypothetical protein